MIALSIAFIALFDFATFAGPVSFVMLCLIPMQIVIAVLWGASLPFAPALRQPAKGLVLVLVNAAVALVIVPLVLSVVGEGIWPPGPIPTHFAIVVVPTTFWLAIMFGGWPFVRFTRNSVLAGLLVLAASYLITYLVFRTVFNYEFLEGTPAYLASAPRGWHDAVVALVFAVTALSVMFLVLCFDLWPLTTAPRVLQQPLLGVVWTLLALAGGALVMQVAVRGLAVDPMILLTRVTAPFIFGAIIVLNMLGNSLFAKTTQPLKGVLNGVTALAIGVALARLYGALAPALSGPLVSGPPSYEFEVWLANALLSVTFPLLIFFAAFFAYWPLPPTAAPEDREAARA